MVFGAPIFNRIAPNVAFYLDRANVPNLLFGWLAIGLADTGKDSSEVDFVIPDAQMPAAIASLVAADYPLCTDTKCGELESDRLTGYARQKEFPFTWKHHYHPKPSAHFHMGGTNILSLHVQSALLWWLPELRIGPPAVDDPDLMLWRLRNNTDSLLPSYSEDPLYVQPAIWEDLPQYSEIHSGQSERDNHPIKILNQNSLVEACIMLYCRDWARNEHLKVLWGHMLTELSDRAPCRTKKNVRARFKRAWDSLNFRIVTRRGFFEEMRALRDRLARDNELGPLVNGETWCPPRHDWTSG
ncbi:hypothetical protein P170DRAFT_476988 [Aspergillus steynii IBT 23096]|uniref:Uncharacterized protein n=1 Tax=Aspergillus steynii IBT 23096 TaxID=1392250 RepID=A0A2I2G670_9EURO|nr:uncharacterized protein P170DRAFT_476988 [Aspergillus steynii IBT 23096]PLB48370.1 hypothetical protein P170DRAFT_476988 [Aspergillus steynii IBT 23096]